MEQEKLLLIPGPTPVHPRIIHSLSLPTVSHVSPVFIRDMKEALRNLKDIVLCRKGEPFIISGAGTLSMEMALLNTVFPSESVLVVSQGYFGHRMTEVAESFGLKSDVVASKWGQAVLPSELESRLKNKKYKAVVSTHVDTATGACAPVEEYARLADRYGSLFLIDGVCATGGIEENMDAWGVDVILTAAQKCFGVPPGLAVLVFSERAMKEREKMGRITAYYADIMRWLPIMKDPSKYFSTPSVNEIRAFAEGTRIIVEEGLKARFDRHAQTAHAFRSALSALGFSIYTNENFLADTLSVVNYPGDVDDRDFRKGLFKNGVVVAGGLGAAAGKVFRMGHMGNLSFSQVEFAVGAIEATLDSLGYAFQNGAGLQAAKAILSST